MNFQRVPKRKGIGNVITTLIVLIASVVLGAGVIFFGGSLFQTNTQQESVKVINTHIWTATNGTATAAFAVQNTGSKPVSITAITIRGISVPQSMWYFNKAQATATNIQTELGPDYNLANGANIDPAPGQEAFTQAAGPISLNQGEAAIVYLNNPNQTVLTPANIHAIDAGLAMSMAMQAGQAQAVQSVSVVLQD